jgi:DinB superfamily
LLPEKTPVLVETMLRDLPNGLMHWRPAAERWAIAEVLGHLAELEGVYADQTQRILTEDTPIQEGIA